MTIQTQKKLRIDAITDFATERLKTENPKEFIQFVQDMYKYAALEELSNRPIDELYAAAFSLWKFCAQRDTDSWKIRVFNPTLEEHGWPATHTIIQIVNDDMPFLLDSITSNLLEDGNELHMLVHPIMPCIRDKDGKKITAKTPGKASAKGGTKITESIMHIEITAMTDPKHIAALEDKLNKVLGFIRAAIDDWKPMLSKMDDVSKNLAATPKSIVDPKQTREAIKFLKWLKDDNFTVLGYREYFYGNKKNQGRRIWHPARPECFCAERTERAGPFLARN